MTRRTPGRPAGVDNRRSTRSPFSFFGNTPNTDQAGLSHRPTRSPHHGGPSCHHEIWARSQLRGPRYPGWPDRTEFRPCATADMIWDSPVGSPATDCDGLWAGLAVVDGPAGLARTGTGGAAGR